jgi:hypothetical protein
MALPLFVVSTVGRGLWNEISKELVTTRLTKYSKTAFAIYVNAVPTRKPETPSLVTRAQIIVFFFLETNNQNIVNMLHNTRDIHN